MTTPADPGDSTAAPEAPNTAGRLSITHLTTFYPPASFGGDGIHVRRLARAQARRGHRVRVVTASGPHSLLDTGGGPGREPDEAPSTPGAGGGVKPDEAGHRAVGSDREPVGPIVHRLGGLAGLVEPFLVHQTGGPVLQRRALRRLLEGPAAPDVVHYHNVSLVGGLRALALGDAVKLYTPHEYWLVCPTHMLFRYGREICRRRTCIRCTLRGGRPPQWWRYTGMRDRYVDEVDAFVFPSELTRSVYREQGLDPPGAVLHHFLPDDYVAAAAAAGRRRRDVEPYFLYVGRLDAVKGVEALVRQFAAGAGPATGGGAARAVPADAAAGAGTAPAGRAFLRVVGEGPLSEPLRRRYGDHPAVEFLGRRRPEELHELYRDALALILPSAGYEVLGLVVLEAFAHGTPAVVTDVGGARELVEASDAGFVYGTPGQLREALQRLADDALRDRRGDLGRQYVRRQHGEADYVRRYEEIVRQVRQGSVPGVP